MLGWNVPNRSGGKKANERAELVGRLDMAGRVLSTAAVLFHTALSEKRGLSASEEKALDLLDRFGPLSAGELSEKSGLAPASVTGLIDRLERKGFAKRAPDSSDGRRVRVEVDRSSLAKLGPLFHELVTNLHAMYESYSSDELKLVLRFLGEAAEVQRKATEGLREQP
jgi:DNA-binding MarR family transcriptional regulator